MTLETLKPWGPGEGPQRYIHRHACHAHEDFRALRRDRDNEALWHSMSHHLRHVVFRSGHEVKQPRRKDVRRAHVRKQHK